MICVTARCTEERDNSLVCVWGECSTESTLRSLLLSRSWEKGTCPAAADKLTGNPSSFCA